MARETTQLVVPDLSTFTRNLGRALNVQNARSAEPMGHLHLQNLIARAAGYRNLQALKAAAPLAPPAHATAQLSANAKRALAQFDRNGRLLRWPTKFSVQRLAMWLLWTRFEGRRIYTEREVNEVLKGANAFGDHVTLRRELVNHRLLTRKSDCSEYRKVAAQPDGEVKPLLSVWRALSTPPLGR
ncbi:MAG TPA: DUF2087 domain-containing protein [Burkholderiaceae bacterium]|nr:DUF2087 domain-containing protein [Burkholderiaceae bacterium]